MIAFSPLFSLYIYLLNHQTCRTMTKFTYQDNELTISYDLQGEPSQKEIIETAIFVLERALGEESVQKHLKDYVSEE